MKLLPSGSAELVQDNEELFNNITLLKFVETEGILVQKTQVRPYGVYEAVLSLDGVNWVHIPQPFGYGFSTHQAVVMLLEKATKAKSQDMINWLGNDRMNRFIKLLKEEGY